MPHAYRFRIGHVTSSALHSDVVKDCKGSSPGAPLSTLAGRYTVKCGRRLAVRSDRLRRGRMSATSCRSPTTANG